MVKKKIVMRQAVLVLLLWGAGTVYAHHGVAGVGALALEGPGAPIESASSAVLPEGKSLLYAKLDQASFKRVDYGSSEADYSQFWMLGVGHGVSSWFSAYLFVPYHIKVDTSDPANGSKYDSRGWADVSLIGQIGFKYDPGQGLLLTPANESLDDLEDWHFSVFAGTSVPSGNPNRRDANGNVVPGKSTGFGKSARTLGMTASKMLSRDLTLNLEASLLRFQAYTYADGNITRFGNEDRLNAALSYRLFGDAGRRFRLDGVLECQYLNLGRDATNGNADENSGGKVLYLMPGLRAFKDNMSFAFGIKLPVVARLNEVSRVQQGAEGKERYRVIASVSYLF